MIRPGIDMKKTILLFLILSIGCFLTGETQQKELKIPSMVFKGKIVMLEDIGEFERIYLNGIEIKTDQVVFSRAGTHTVTIVQGRPSIDLQSLFPGGSSHPASSPYRHCIGTDFQGSGYFIIYGYILRCPAVESL